MNSRKLISGAWTCIYKDKRVKGDLPRNWAYRKVKPSKCVVTRPINQSEVK